MTKLKVVAALYKTANAASAAAVGHLDPSCFTVHDCMLFTSFYWSLSSKLAFLAVLPAELGQQGIAELTVSDSTDITGAVFILLYAFGVVLY